MGSRSVEPAPQEGSQAPRGSLALEARGSLTGEGLPRRQRLSRARDIEAVIRTGFRSRTPRIELYWLSNRAGYPRLGVIVPRYGATAVARNRLRRRLREYLRRRLAEVGARDVVVRARPAAYASSPRELAADVEQWLGAIRC
jgi:ribonuclease P protein component